MRLSIRVRTILALNVFVLALTLAMGYIKEVAGRVVEERFAKEMANGVSGYLKDKGSFLKDTVMTDLRKMFHAEWLAAQTTRTNVVASSLDPPLTAQFRSQISAMNEPGVMQLGGQSYRLDWADVPVQNPQTGQTDHYRLFMLVPYAQFEEARKKASLGVLRIMLPAAALATLLAILLAFSITRPIRKLAGEMDRLATDDSTDLAASVPTAKGPQEIARLAASFHQLLARLSAARLRLARHERLATLGKVCLSVAHELRNPLSGIKMHAGCSRTAWASPPRVARHHGPRDRPHGALPRRADGPLAGGDPTQRPLDLAATRLSQLAEGVLAILSGKCRHAKVAVTKQFPADEPTLQADSNQLRQVMMNLMVNAIQAMPAGGTLRLGLGRGPAAVRFEVGDTGKGVATSGATSSRRSSPTSPTAWAWACISASRSSLATAEPSGMIARRSARPSGSSCRPRNRNDTRQVHARHRRRRLHLPGVRAVLHASRMDRSPGCHRPRGPGHLPPPEPIRDLPGRPSARPQRP